MTTQPEALRLADELDHGVGTIDRVRPEAAAELRRLYQFAEDQIGRATAVEAALQMTKATHALKLAAVEAQRDALLEAVTTLINATKSSEVAAEREACAITCEQAEPVAWAQKAALDGVREYGEIIATLYANGYQPEQEWTEPLYTAPKVDAAMTHSVIQQFLERTGQYVTNDASREAAIAAAVAAEREAYIEIVNEYTDDDGLCCAADLLSEIRERGEK